MSAFMPELSSYHRLYSPQSLKYLLLVLLCKCFAQPCSQGKYTEFPTSHVHVMSSLETCTFYIVFFNILIFYSKHAFSLGNNVKIKYFTRKIPP